MTRFLLLNMTHSCQGQFKVRNHQAPSSLFLPGIFTVKLSPSLKGFSTPVKV